MTWLELNPADFKVIDACTQEFSDGSTEDFIMIEVAPDYFCDMYIHWDNQGAYALPRGCSDGVGYIYKGRYSNMDTTDATVSDEDIWAAEDFALDYYLKHPEKFDAE